MNWSALSAIAGTIGSVGTVIGLIFVYIQLRNLVHSQYARTSQNIMSHEKDLWQIVLNDDTMIEILSGHLGFDKDFLNEQGIERTNAIELILFFRQYENIYYQNINKMLPPNLWHQWVTSMEHTFKNKVARECLKRSKVGYSEDFKKFIQEEVFPKDLISEDEASSH